MVSFYQVKLSYKKSKLMIERLKFWKKPHIKVNNRKNCQRFQYLEKLFLKLLLCWLFQCLSTYFIINFIRIKIVVRLTFFCVFFLLILYDLTFVTVRLQSWNLNVYCIHSNNILKIAVILYIDFFFKETQEEF